MRIGHFSSWQVFDIVTHLPLYRLFPDFLHVFLILFPRVVFIDGLENNFSCSLSPLILVSSPCVVLTYVNTCFDVDVIHSCYYFFCHMFSKLFLIHQLHVPHQFNLLYFCILCAKCNHFVWWYVTAKLFEWIYLPWCDSFYNNFGPFLFHSHFHCSVSSFIISCCIFPVCYSNGFLLTHEMNSDYVLLNKLFCYIVINMWEECRFYLHVTLFYHSAFQQVISVSSNISAYWDGDFAVLSVYSGIVISTIQLFCCEPAAAWYDVSGTGVMTSLARSSPDRLFPLTQAFTYRTL